MPSASLLVAPKVFNASQELAAHLGYVCPIFWRRSFGRAALESSRLQPAELAALAMAMIRAQELETCCFGA